MNNLFLDRANLRIQITIALSVGAHVVLFSLFGNKNFQETPKQLKLTEVEFQEEVVKPTEIEKLMTRLTAPPKSIPAVAPEKIAEITAIKELQKESFSKVVGLQRIKPIDEIAEADLSKLAALPKLDSLVKPLAPAIQKSGPKTIALTRSQPSAIEALESKVVPLDELPPADFGPDISRRDFQQPELIIKKVKAERQDKKTVVDVKKQLSLQRDTLISGEVKDREILNQASPRVPRWLEEKGVQSEVVIRFVVNPDGEVGDKMFVERTSGYAELDRLAMEALKQFVFAPLPLNVKQVEQSGTIVIRFIVKGR